MANSPCISTIAVVRSLLVRSRFVDEKNGFVSPGTEALSDNKVKREGL